MARWPKTDFERSQTSRPQFAVPLDKAVAWSRERNLWVGGYFGYDWYFESAPLSAIDSTHGIVTLYPLSSSYPSRPGLRYFIYNALSELLAPGEYVADWSARQLFVWPYDDDLSSNPIEVASAEGLIDLRGATHVRIEGIAFENARGNAIQIRDSVDIVLKDCLVANVGGNGIIVDGGQGVRVVRSVITDAGESGIILAGGNRATLQSAGHAVVDSAPSLP
jgi:Right handed beta helix region